MNIKRILISGITAVVAIVLIALSFFSNSILIAGKWTPALTELEIDDIEEETGRMYDENDETTEFELFGGMEYNTAGEKAVKGSFSFSGNKISIKLGDEKATKSYYSVSDNELHIYEEKEDFYLDNTTEYKRLGGISLAMIIRIIGLVFAVAAIALFIILKDRRAPVNTLWESSKRFVYSGVIAVVAVILLVVSFVDASWQVAGTWRPRLTNLQKEEYASAYGEEFNPKKHKTNFNIYGRMYVTSKDLTEAYEYNFYNGKIYQTQLTEDEPGKFIDDGGNTSSRMYKFKNGYLYIYDSEDKLNAGYFDKYERVGLSFSLLIQIVSVVLIGVAVAIAIFVKGKQPDEYELEAAEAELKTAQ